MRAVIFANGSLGNLNQAIQLIRPDDLIIAADGGSLNCLSTGHWPNTVIGDLDSLSSELIGEFKKRNIRLLEAPRDKDKTDLELAIQFALDQGVTEVLFLGLYGERLDQTLANLLLLTRDEWKDIKLMVLSGADTAYLLRSGDSLNVDGKPGDIVSLIPLSERVQGVSTQGLRWPLSDAELSYGTTLSISNEIVTPDAGVKIQSGKLLVIHRKSVSGDN